MKHLHVVYIFNKCYFYSGNFCSGNDVMAENSYDTYNHQHRCDVDDEKKEGRRMKKMEKKEGVKWIVSCLEDVVRSCLGSV